MRYMRNDTIGGINPSELDDIMMELNNDIDSITTTLHDIQMKLYNTKEYFKGDVADELQHNFGKYSEQYDLIKDNLNSYIRDLMNVKTMMNKIDTDAALEITDYKEEKRIASDDQNAENVQRMAQASQKLGTTAVNENIL